MSTAQPLIYSLNIPGIYTWYIPGMAVYSLFQQPILLAVARNYDLSRRCDCWWILGNGTLPSSATPATGWSIHSQYTMYVPCIYIVYYRNILIIYHVYPKYIHGIYSRYTIHMYYIYNVYTKDKRIYNEYAWYITGISHPD